MGMPLAKMDVGVVVGRADGGGGGAGTSAGVVLVVVANFGVQLNKKRRRETGRIIFFNMTYRLKCQYREKYSF
jgi:hypothetical protein